MSPRRFAVFVPVALLGFSILATGAAAQFPPAPKPFEPKMPQGSAGCQISKPCAEVAPEIIKNALGPSPLESNLREFTGIIGGSVAGSPAADKAAEWALQAFRRAGVVHVRTESFTVPVGWAKGRTRLAALPNKITGAVKSENVVAEIRGSEEPDDFVLLGAPLDSSGLGDGALDDGCSAALVIDAARAILASGSVPMRSIRFVLFTGEEQGMLGSWAYARAHRRELNRMDAAIIFAAGGGKLTGYSLGGRKDIAATLAEALAPLASFGPFTNTTGARIGAGNFDFLLEGVPTLVANQQPGSCTRNDRTAPDTLDKVNFAQLKRNVAIAAVTAYSVADLPVRLGPRQTRTQIAQLIEETGLEPEMKKTGLWPMWIAGTRGRRP